MAVMHQEKAGQWAKQKSRNYHLSITLALMCSLFFLGGAVGFLYGRFQWQAASAMGLLAVGIFFLLMRKIFKITERWQKQRIGYIRGAQAEAFVSWYLRDDLSNDWHVFNNLRCAQGGDVDHVVVGPGGLFVISTKSYKGYVDRSPSGTVCLNKKPIENECNEARQLALWVRDRLRATLGDQVPWVQAVLALPHATVDFKPTETPVWIVDETTLIDTLAPEKPRMKLGGKRIEQITAELARATS